MENLNPPTATFETVTEAFETMANRILVPADFMPLANSAVSEIHFKQTRAQGIILHDDFDTPRIVIGASFKKFDGIQVVMSGDYELVTYSGIIHVDYPKVGEKNRVRGYLSSDRFLFVRRMSKRDFRRGPWGYAFWHPG